jgi:transposase
MGGTDASRGSVPPDPAHPVQSTAFSKAKVEGGVLIVQRWIVAALRHRTFFSLVELNGAIRELVGKLNTRPFQKLEGCRRSTFEAMDKPAMRPLPARRYELAEWKHAKVHIDYCVAFDQRHYSVPYALVGESVEIRATAAVVEVLHRGTRVACHARHYGPKGAATIAEEHRPHAHREYGKWPPDRVVAWAESIGAHVGKLAGAIMSRRTHPETGYRACLGVIRLADRFGRDRTDAACARALSIGSPNFKSVQAILKSGLDRTPLLELPARPTIDHDNIRGASYFDKEETGDPRRNDSEAHEHEATRDGRAAARDDHVSTGRRPLH